MAIVGDRNGWKLDGARARVEKHMEMKPRRRVGRVVVELDLPSGFSQDERAKLEETARGCPVATSLSSDVRIDLTLRWGA
jgi:uncharacterized OsmC-like protein